jgi:tetratricopeptide (TPR) repeat protein
MYPHLSPDGLVMKLNRQPLSEMSKDTVRNDQDYWMRFTDGALGKWLTPTTSVEVICALAEKVFLEKDMDGFTGDAKFVQNDQACKTYSKLRSSMAGVYAWRAKNGASAEEKQRMTSAADFAFRQAFALCPYSPEAVFRYVNLLTEQKRIPEALLVVETAQKLDPGNRSLGNLYLELERIK